MANNDGTCAFVSENDRSTGGATARPSDVALELNLFTPSDLTASIFKTLIKRLSHNKSLILDLPHPLDLLGKNLKVGIQKPLFQDGEPGGRAVLIPLGPSLSEYGRSLCLLSHQLGFFKRSLPYGTAMEKAQLKPPATSDA